MADLTELQSSQPVKIAGSDSSGSETNFVNSTSNGHILSADISSNGGLQAALTVGTSAVEVKVGASPLSNRKEITVFNNSGSTIYFGFTSGVTTSTGTPLFEKQMYSDRLGAGTSLWLIAGSAGNNVRITEKA